MASSNAKLNEALAIFGRDEPTWANLYVVFEIIQEGTGGPGQIEKRGWASTREVGKFKKNANDRRLSGSAARHGKTESGALMYDKMALDEGAEFIRTLLRRWIGSAA